MFKTIRGVDGAWGLQGRALPSQHLPWFQRLEMTEEEEGELPAFQQFGTKVLAVMKPPPEEEQPRDRVGPADQSGSGSPSRWLCTPEGLWCFTAPGEVVPPREVPAWPWHPLPLLHRSTSRPWGSSGVSPSPPSCRG